MAGSNLVLALLLAAAAAQRTGTSGVPPHILERAQQAWRQQQGGGATPLPRFAPPQAIYKDGGATSDGAELIPQVTHSGDARAAQAQREAAAAQRALAAARRDLAAIDARGAVALAAAAPPRNASGTYKKPAGDAVSVSAMLAAASRWAYERCAATDPERVRDSLGMKGVKHFTEWLDLQRLAVARGDARTATAALERVREVVPRALGSAGYHAWTSFPRDSWRFRQDSMSYMRAHYLCAHTELGFQRSEPALMVRWRRTIEKHVAEVWRHLETRGIDQRLNFVKLFRALGLYVEGQYNAEGRDDKTGDGLASRADASFDALPSALELNGFEAATFETTLIHRREPLGWYMLSRDRPYDITHEIFALTDDGRFPFPFLAPADVAYERDASGGLAKRDAPDEPRAARYFAYALQTVVDLLKLHVRRDELDIVCEYVVNLGQLGVRARRSDDGSVDFALGELYLQGRDYVASRRNADGTFGDSYDQDAVRAAKQNPNYDVDVGGTLHTTYVCLWALTQPVYDDDDAQSSWAGAHTTDAEHVALAEASGAEPTLPPPPPPRPEL